MQVERPARWRSPRRRASCRCRSVRRTSPSGRRRARRRAAAASRRARRCPVPHTRRELVQGRRDRRRHHEVGPTGDRARCAGRDVAGRPRSAAGRRRGCRPPRADCPGDGPRARAAVAARSMRCGPSRNADVIAPAIARTHRRAPGSSRRRARARRAAVRRAPGERARPTPAASDRARRRPPGTVRRRAGRASRAVRLDEHVDRIDDQPAAGEHRLAARLLDRGDPGRAPGRARRRRRLPLASTTADTANATAVSSGRSSTWTNEIPDAIDAASARDPRRRLHHRLRSRSASRPTAHGVRRRATRSTMRSGTRSGRREERPRLVDDRRPRRRGAAASPGANRRRAATSVSVVAGQPQRQPDRRPPLGDVVVQVAEELLVARVEVGCGGDQEQIEIDLVEAEPCRRGRRAANRSSGPSEPPPSGAERPLRRRSASPADRSPPARAARRPSLDRRVGRSATAARTRSSSAAKPASVAAPHIAVPGYSSALAAVHRRSGIARTRKTRPGSSSAPARTTSSGNAGAGASSAAGSARRPRPPPRPRRGASVTSSGRTTGSAASR